MKAKSLFAAVLAICLVSACGVALAQDLIETQIKSKTGPIIKRFFESLMAKDYDDLRADFSSKMKTGLPVRVLEQGDRDDFSKFGPQVSWDYAGWFREGGFDIVLVHATHGRGDVLQYKFVFGQGPDRTKIEGLWKKPLPKGLSAKESGDWFKRFGAIAQNHLEAIKAKDYEKAGRDFSDKMKQVLGPAALQKTLEQDEAIARHGALSSWEFAHAKTEGELVGLYYRATFSMGETLHYKFEFKQKGDDKIQGLWIRPLGAE